MLILALMRPYNATIKTLVTLSKKLIIYLDLQLLSTVSKLKILLTTASDYKIKWKNSLINLHHIKIIIQ